MSKFALVAVAAALVAAGAAQASSVVKISNCGKLVQHPKSIVIACGDGNYLLKSLKWGAWGGTTASATGSASVNNCTPNCAAGKFHSYPVKVTAWKLGTCKSTKVYTRLTIRFTAARPKLHKAKEVEKLVC